MFRKTFVIVFGLPGVGKSYTARMIAQRLDKAYHLDSDRFAVDFVKDENIDFVNLPVKEQVRIREAKLQAKIDKISKKFLTNDVVILDAHLDLPKARAMYLAYSKENNLRYLIVEVYCPKDLARKRVFENRHETERQLGNPTGRWSVYERLEASWKSPARIDFRIDTSKNTAAQIEQFIKQFFSD